MYVTIIFYYIVYMYVHVCVCLCIYIYHNFFNQSPFDGHLSCFHALSIINISSMNIGSQVSFQIKVFISFG